MHVATTALHQAESVHLDLAGGWCTSDDPCCACSVAFVVLATAQTAAAMTMRISIKSSLSEHDFYFWWVVLLHLCHASMTAHAALGRWAWSPCAAVSLRSLMADASLCSFLFAYGCMEQGMRLCITSVPSSRPHIQFVTLHLLPSLAGR
jgi:hypothetical protein